MSITKAEILTFVTACIKAGDTQAEVDQYIELVLDDLSDLHVLKAQDLTVIALTSSSLYIPYPADALDDQQAIISVALTDSSGNREWPVEPIEGGWDEYQRQMEDFTDSMRGTPSVYVCADRKVYLWPPPDGTYTGELWYFQRHPEDADNIAFTDSWKRALKFGAAYEAACAHKLAEQIAIWGAKYEEEKLKQAMIHRDSVAITGGCNS